MLKSIVFFLIFGFTSVHAQPSIKTELITIGPGQNYWEAFGHSALRIKTGNQDLMYGFGYFNFNDDDFFLNFAKGEMQYFLGIEYTDKGIDDFGSQNRQIWSQKLNLSLTQKIALIDKLNFLAQEQNRYYHYDYFLNNCTSQIRDLLNEVTNGEIAKQLKPLNTQISWNAATFPVDNQTWMNLGIAIAYGLPAYKNRNRWQLSVFPEHFARDIEQLTSESHWNSPMTLVNHPKTTNHYSFFETHYAMLLCVLMLLLGIGFVKTRWFTIHMWLLLQSLLGCGLLMLWFLTQHSVAAYNINVLLFFPLGFLLIFKKMSNNFTHKLYLFVNICWVVAAVFATNLYLIGFWVVNIMIYFFWTRSKLSLN